MYQSLVLVSQRRWERHMHTIHGRVQEDQSDQAVELHITLSKGIRGMFGHDFGHVQVHALILLGLDDLHRAVDAALAIGLILGRLFRHGVCFRDRGKMVRWTRNKDKKSRATGLLLGQA